MSGGFTFGNTQPLLLLREATEGGLQSLGHHLFTSWSQQGDVATLWICRSQIKKNIHNVIIAIKTHGNEVCGINHYSQATRPPLYFITE